MRYPGKEAELSILKGVVIKEIRGIHEDSNEVRIDTLDGREYLFCHQKECCEKVYLNDFEGYAKDLAGAVILSAEEVKNSGEVTKPSGFGVFSWKWTFYKIETNKGGLWMRWLGESSGYYSEIVDFILVDKQ